MYAKKSFNHIVQLAESEVAERCWHLIKLDHCNILVANWYRPPGSDDTVIDSFREELCKFMSSASVCVVAGDLNLHHKRWLKYSNDNSSQGDMMQNICLENRLECGTK